MIIHFIILIFMCYFHVFFMCGRNKYLGRHGILKQVGVNVCCSVVCDSLCDPMGCSPPGSSVHGILQQEYWCGLPFPSPGDLYNPGLKPRFPTLQADSLLPESSEKPVNG